MDELIKKFAEHFYEEPDNPNELRQGDLIDLRKFEEKYFQQSKTQILDIYPYFFNHYLYGVILSQCCDLDHLLKLDCIQIGAIRPFAQVINEVLKKSGKCIKDGVFINDEKNSNKVRNIIHDFLNHESKIHFLYPTFIDRMPFPGALRLDVTVSLRTDCKNALLASRISSIKDIYRSRLSWKLSDLYDRVGLPAFDKILSMNETDKKEKTNKFMRTLLKYESKE